MTPMIVAVCLAGIVYTLLLTVGFALSPLRGIFPQPLVVCIGLVMGGLIALLLHGFKHDYPSASAVTINLFWGAMFGLAIADFWGLLAPCVEGRERILERFPPDPHRSLYGDMRAIMEPVTSIAACGFVGGLFIGVLATVLHL
ncbi:MAG: hypothetical protein ACR2JW_00435 [Thermomicrobiales bacterium]